jgi:hypothetical protein
MPITTYRSSSDAANFVRDDKDLNEWLTKGFYVEKRVIKRFLRRPVVLYQLLFDLDGEYQIINFPPPNAGDDSINTWVPRQVILAYLIGRTSDAEAV